MTKVAVIGGRRLKKRIGARLRHAGMEVEHVGACSSRRLVPVQSRPDVVMLDLSSSRGEQASPSTLRSLREAQGDARGGPPLLVLVSHRNPVMFASLRPLLQEGVADFVRLPSVDAEADVDEDAAEEVLERTQLLLERVRHQAEGASSPGASSEQWPQLLPELHAASGRLDARRVADFFGLPLAALGRAVGVSRAALHKTPDAPSLQPKLHPWHTVASVLLAVLQSKEAARAWLHTPNPDLENQTPLALMQGGEADVVAALLRDVVTGQPG